MGAVTPLAWLAWFYLYVVRQRVLLGYWPLPYQPDPKTAGLVIHHMSVYFSFFAVPIIALITLGWLVRCRIADPSYPWRKPAVFLAASFAIWIITLVADPGSYFAWFLD